MSSPRIVFHELILPPNPSVSVLFRHTPGKGGREKSCPVFPSPSLIFPPYLFAFGQGESRDSSGLIPQLGETSPDYSGTTTRYTAPYGWSLLVTSHVLTAHLSHFFTSAAFDLLIGRFVLERKDKREFWTVETGVWIRTGVSEAWTLRMTRYTLCSPNDARDANTISSSWFGPRKNKMKQKAFCTCNGSGVGARSDK